MENNKKGFFAPSKLKAALAYVIGLFILSMIIGLIAAAIMANARNVDVNTVMSSFFESDGLPQYALDINKEAVAWGNFFGYLVSLIFVCIWMRNDIVTDYQALLANKKKYAIIIPIFAISFVLLAVGIDQLFTRIVPDSDNQATIISMLHSGALVPTIIMTIFFAPIVEELIYRKAIFNAFKSISIIPAYITSTILFAVPHMISSTSDVVVWLIQLVPYLLCGFLLCLVYHKSKFNIYASIVAHILNNLVALILVFIL